ncbi:13981_t:CDS:2, partial [Racocetra fulgida]
GGKLAGMTPEQQREQFIRGLNPMNQYNIRMIAKFEDTQKNITKALAEAEKFTLSQRNTLSSLPTMFRATKTLDNSKKSSKKRAEDIGINRFLSDLLRKNLGKHPADEYNHDPIEDISDSLTGLTLNSVIKTAKSSLKKSSKTLLEETICKVLQSELKLIFPDHFSQDPIKANIPNQAPLIQEKIESQSNTSPITK